MFGGRPRCCSVGRETEAKTVHFRIEAATITVFQNVDLWQWWLMCALVSRERDSAKSFFLPIYRRGGSKLHYRAYRGNIQKLHLYIGINEHYNINTQINGINTRQDFQKMNSIYRPLFNRIKGQNNSNYPLSTFLIRCIFNKSF